MGEHVLALALGFALDALLLRWVKTTGAERFSHLS